MAKRKTPKRKPISKTIRFEVFKRDSFTCQYCGQAAPDVVLEADHIIPVKKGGPDDILNLVTSCFDCNRGKGARRLSDKTVVQKAHRQARQLQEQLEQIEMMAKWQTDLVTMKDAEFDAYERALWGPINSHNDSLGSNDSFYEFGDHGKKIAKRNIRRFGLKECLEAIAISHESYLETNTSDGKINKDSLDKVMDKIGGICFVRRQRGEV